MKKTLLNLLNNYGIWLQPKVDLPYSYSVGEYQAIDGEGIELHKEFLESITAEENKRLISIENKSSQLVSQTGIFFSLLSLFIPIIIDKINEQTFYIRLVCMVILMFAFLFYVLTIVNAAKNFNINKFKYSKPSPLNVIKYQKESTSKFNAIVVKDLLHGANQNLKTNNDKATNLIHSYNAFRAANMLTAVLALLICVSLLFANQKEKSTVDSVKIVNLDSAINVIVKSIDAKQSSLEQSPRAKADTAHK